MTFDRLLQNKVTGNAWQVLLSKTSFPSELHERRSVLERLLRARLVYTRAAMARALSFEYLNRQLVWHELSELLLFLLPLVNVGRLKAAVMARLPRLGPPVAPAGVGAGMTLLPRVWLGSSRFSQHACRAWGCTCAFGHYRHSPDASESG